MYRAQTRHVKMFEDFVCPDMCGIHAAPGTLRDGKQLIVFMPFIARFSFLSGTAQAGKPDFIFIRLRSYCFSKAMGTRPAMLPLPETK